MSRAKVKGDFNDLSRRIQRGMQEGMRRTTLEALRQVKQENPVDTGRSRSAWTWKFDPSRLRGLLGNNVWYIRLVAEGGMIAAHVIRPRRAKALRFKAGGRTVFATRANIPARRVPSTAKERRNIGFHKRGVAKALKRAPEFLAQALRKAGVPIK